MAQGACTCICGNGSKRGSRGALYSVPDRVRVCACGRVSQPVVFVEESSSVTRVSERKEKDNNKGNTYRGCADAARLSLVELYSPSLRSHSFPCGLVILFSTASAGRCHVHQQDLLNSLRADFSSRARAELSLKRGVAAGPAAGAGDVAVVVIVAVGWSGIEEAKGRVVTSVAGFTTARPTRRTCSSVVCITRAFRTRRSCKRKLSISHL
jgi:hypothetical protein